LSTSNKDDDDYDDEEERIVLLIHSFIHSLKQVALLSQRGRAMLRVCQ